MTHNILNIFSKLPHNTLKLGILHHMTEKKLRDQLLSIAGPPQLVRIRLQASQ